MAGSFKCEFEVDCVSQAGETALELEARSFPVTDVLSDTSVEWPGDRSMCLPHLSLGALILLQA